MKTDLELASTQELIDELFRRSAAGVVALITDNTNDARGFRARHSGRLEDCSFLATMLTQLVTCEFFTRLGPLPLDEEEPGA